MLKKRTLAESRKDEQTKDESGLFQEDDDAIRAKLTPLSDTTLKDLPIEILGYILVKAVALEVKGLKLAKSVWKEKADTVASRLRTVCSQWDSILTTNFFWNELNRTLDSTGQAIRLEVLHQSSFQSTVHRLTTLKDEIFLLCSPRGRGPMVINVYDRNNMEEEKDVIHLPGISPIDMAACSVSNCVYILDKQGCSPSIFRITKDEEHNFKMSPWISDRRLEVSNRGPISVSASGNLIILSGREFKGFIYLVPADTCIYRSEYPGILIYAANGSLQSEIMVSPDVERPRIIHSVIQKPNGNLVLLSSNDVNEAKLLEVDPTGRIVRRYQSSRLNGYRLSLVSFADIHGRILINDDCNLVELLDAELNPMEIAVPLFSDGRTWYPGHPPQHHFNSERNEIVRVEKYKYDSVTFIPHNTALTIFRLTEDEQRSTRMDVVG